MSNCDADALEVLTDLPHDVAVSPLARLLFGHVVAELRPQSGGHLDEVLAPVAVLRRRSPLYRA